MSGSIIAAEPGAPGTNLIPSGTVTQPELEAQIATLTRERDEWRNRFTGQQGAYSREQQKWQGDAVKLNDVSTQLAAAVSERDAAKILQDAVSGSLSVMELELETKNLQLERTQILIKKFPELLSFEADGLLPDGSGSAFEATLTKFKERLSNNGKDAAKQQMLGGSPPPPGGTTPKTATELWNAAKQAARDGKQVEYEQLYTDYLAAIARKE